MPKISVIIPVYKTEKYLEKCLNSILEQTFRDFEVLLVDDGSPDECAAMCDRYKKVDARVKVFHKENGGLSSARNYGIGKSAGEYLTFVDSDDYVAPEFLEVLYNKIESGRADMAVCGIYDVYASKINKQWEKEEEFDCTGEEIFGYILEGRMVSGSSCAKLYRRNIFENARFPEGMLYEDAYFLSEAVRWIKNASVTTRSLYYYVHREGSITTTPFKPRDMDVIRAYRHNLRVIHKYFPKLIPRGEFRYLWAHFVVLDRILQTDNYKKTAEYSEVLGFLRKHILRVVFCKYFRLKRRIAAVILLFSVRAYRVLAVVKMQGIIGK